MLAIEKMKREVTPENSKIQFPVSRVWGKKYTQSMLKRLRDAGYESTKVSGMYQVRNPKDNNQLVLQAAPGMNGYLVRYSEALFQEAEVKEQNNG